VVSLHVVVGDAALSRPRVHGKRAGHSRNPLTTLLSPSPHRSTWCVRSLRAVMGVGIALALSGCIDASSMFTGRWKYEGTAIDQSWLQGAPVLAIGHFGEELTGVVRFEDNVGIDIDPACPCAFLDHVSLSLSREEFVSTSVGCDGTVLVWDLMLDTGGQEPVLEGTVTGAGESVAVRLVQTGVFIRAAEKDCPSAFPESE
jgi:hypothetical protein